MPLFGPCRQVVDGLRAQYSAGRASVTFRAASNLLRTRNLLRTGSCSTDGFCRLVHMVAHTFTVVSFRALFLTAPDGRGLALAFPNIGGPRLRLRFRICAVPERADSKLRLTFCAKMH